MRLFFFIVRERGRGARWLYDSGEVAQRVIGKPSDDSILVRDSCTIVVVIIIDGSSVFERIDDLNKAKLGIVGVDCGIPPRIRNAGLALSRGVISEGGCEAASICLGDDTKKFVIRVSNQDIVVLIDDLD